MIAAGWFLVDTLNHWPDAKESAVNYTYQILSALEHDPNAPPPTPYSLGCKSQIVSYTANGSAEYPPMGAATTGI